MARLAGKSALVTGGARGIGEAICKALAREGAKVGITDLQQTEGRRVVKSIRNAGGTARYWQMDVTREGDVKRVLKQVAAAFDGIDILVNNAAIFGPNKPTTEITESEWDRVMDVNVKGVFFCTKHVIPHMTGRGGSIINLSSVYGTVGAPNSPPYHASKGAVRMMTKTDALLYARQGIRVNAVQPSFVETGMLRELMRGMGDTGNLRDELTSLLPLGRIGRPEDVAWGVIYLASDEASFVTGTELVIDGGYTAR